jgi:hypothetical protein
LALKVLNLLCHFYKIKSECYHGLDQY